MQGVGVGVGVGVGWLGDLSENSKTFYAYQVREWLYVVYELVSIC